MKKLPYESALTLIYDPVASNRNATRASLHSLGFRKVELAASFDLLLEHLQTLSPDLLLCEVAGAENEVCYFIQSVRQGMLGNNPFIVIMATTWRRDSGIIGQVVNSGADDLVVRPISTTVLGERIRAQIERRKNFVVTSDYIGPDRRRDPGRNSVECVEVPNSLRVRTIEGLNAEEADHRIAETLDLGRTKLNLEKLRRDAITLQVQCRMLAQKTPGTRDFFELLPRTENLSSEIKRRAAGDAANAAAPWCEAIADSVRALLAVRHTPDSGVDFAPILHRLGKAASALGQIFSPGESGSSEFMAIEAIKARAGTPRLPSQAA